MPGTESLSNEARQVIIKAFNLTDDEQKKFDENITVQSEPKDDRILLIQYRQATYQLRQGVLPPHPNRENYEKFLQLPAQVGLADFFPVLKGFFSYTKQDQQQFITLSTKVAGEHLAEAINKRMQALNHKSGFILTNRTFIDANHFTVY